MEPTNGKNRIAAKDLPDTAKQLAANEINAMAREANRRGGFVETAKKLEGQTETLAGHVMTIARTAEKLVSSPVAKLQYFRALCNHAETVLKEREDVDNVKDVIPCWPVIKSTIGAAMDEGIYPSQFDSYNALRKALQDKRGKARAPHHNVNGEAPGAATNAQPAGEGDEPVAAGTGDASPKVRVIPKLQTAINAETALIASLDDEQQEQFADFLIAALAEFRAEYLPDAGTAGTAADAADAGEQRMAESA